MSPETRAHLVHAHTRALSHALRAAQEAVEGLRHIEVAPAQRDELLLLARDFDKLVTPLLAAGATPIKVTYAPFPTA